MEIKNFTSCQRKAKRKRRLPLHLFLSSPRFLFFFLVCCYLIQETSNSQITLKITGNGEERLINHAFSSKISQVSVDGISKPDCNDICSITGSSIPVIIEFSTDITSCAEMFIDQTNIVEVDLSLFDTSKVTEMNSMFKNCQILEKITFGNIVTTSVTNMERFAKIVANYDQLIFQI